MPQQQYRMIICNRLCTPAPFTDDPLEYPNDFYTSPVFLWDGSHDALNDLIDAYLKYFRHFLDWIATTEPV